MRSCSKSGKAIRIRLVPVNFCLQMEAAAQTDRRKVTLYLPVQQRQCRWIKNRERRDEYIITLLFAFLMDSLRGCARLELPRQLRGLCT
jgi:hypothetical protein